MNKPPTSQPRLHHPQHHWSSHGGASSGSCPPSPSPMPIEGFESMIATVFPKIRVICIIQVITNRL